MRATRSSLVIFFVDDDTSITDIMLSSTDILRKTDAS